MSLTRMTAISLSAALLAPFALAEEDQAVTPADLVGTWDVSLFYSPDAPPSKTEMVIVRADDGTLDGTFYQSPFSESGYTVFEDDVLFTVATSDNSGPYYTSGRLSGECIDGQTLAVGRQFLMAWRACPKDSASE